MKKLDFWGSGWWKLGRKFNRKSIKNRSQDRVRPGMDFWWNFGGFGEASWCWKSTRNRFQKVWKHASEQESKTKRTGDVLSHLGRVFGWNGWGMGGWGHARAWTWQRVGDSIRPPKPNFQDAPKHPLDLANGNWERLGLGHWLFGHGLGLGQWLFGL